MRVFQCARCEQTLYFENHRCERCSTPQAFDPISFSMVALTENGQSQSGVGLCANAQHGVCNWLAAPTDPGGLCLACASNRTIPNLGDSRQIELWKTLETAKHRLVYGLLQLGLPLRTKLQNPAEGLAFDFMGSLDPRFREDDSVMTGHADGVVTIHLAEADDVEREKVRNNMAEPYRTVLGHFRHEIGHYYWQLLVAPNPERLNAFRERFGDERADYGEALDRHYNEGPPNDWRAQYVSAYATSHPWEDFAESWAHYLHIVDTLETAYSFGIQLRPRHGERSTLSGKAAFNPYRPANFETLLDAWWPITFAVNSLNRSMGQPDLYPFVLSQPAIDKLAHVHALIRACDQQEG